MFLEHSVSARFRRLWRKFPVGTTALVAFLIGAVVPNTLLVADDSKPKAKSEVGDQDQPNSANSAALYGQLIDDIGKPVTDAKLTLFSENQGDQRGVEAEVDDKGKYSFGEIPDKGNYVLQIESTRWLGLTDWNDRPRVTLSPTASTQRNFTLPRACRMKIRAVDEESGLPIKGVQLYVALVTASHGRYAQPVLTDEDEWTAISRAKVPGGKYIIAAVHKDYALDHITQALDDPESVPRRTFLLKKGKTIIGRAVCNDGKPPAGWQIHVLPTWWKFGTYVRSYEIDGDGLFRLNHIVPEKYDVMISIPLGGGFSTMSNVVSNSELTEIEEPLEVKMDYPSPSSLVYIAGTLVTKGELPPNERIQLTARQSRGLYPYHASLTQGTADFRFGPMPKGVYTIDVFASSIEPATLKNIEAPCDDLEVKVQVRNKPKLQGVVLGDLSGKPLVEFHVRVRKLRTLGGPHYYQDDSWRNISDEGGAFSIDVISPGEYQVTAFANGFGPVTSEMINTVDQPDKSVTLRMKPGLILRGLVVDESGTPISGATVTSLAIAPRDHARLAAKLDQTLGSVATVDGGFALGNLAEGKESLRVSHPDFCSLEVNRVDIKPGSTEELKLTLNRGATITGRVYNENGEPEPNAPVVFHHGGGYEFQQQPASQFANVVTDRQGFFKALHLPSQLVFASRELTTQSRGVTRRAILAENGKSQTIDFGGTSQLIGRIHVNDKPLSNTRIQLGSGTHGVGIMHQFAMTGDDGRFVFHGAAPGRWILSYQLPPPSFSWIHLQEIDVPASGSSDLSLIEQQTGKVIVNFTDATSEQLDNFYLQLTIYDPAHLSFEQAGHLVQRGSLTDPFVFVQVPLGEYSITGYLKNDQLLRRLAVTEQSRSPSITLKFPVGTASINGVIDQELIEPGKRPFFNLWNVDGSWRSSFQPNDDGTFQIENLAGGKYEIRRGQFQNEDLIDSIALSEGEKKSIHLNPESIKKGADVNRQLTVKVYTTNGAPIPCDVRLEGDKGLSMSRTRYSETTNFTVAPGTYRLTATLAGFKSVTQTVDIASTNEKPTEIKVELERLTE